MRRLLLILLVLAGIALLAGLAAQYLADDLGGAGDVVIAWHLEQPIVDYAARPLLPWGEIVPGEASLIELYRALEAARDDAAVSGVALYIHDARFGIAKAQQIRRQLGELRAAGKFVECYLETAGEGYNGTLGYYVATACERIHLAPGGDVNLLGLLADRTFLRGTFDKLKIDPQFLHVGRYKSAVEAYTRSESSEEAAAALAALLDDFYSDIVAAIATARGLDESTVAVLIDGAPYGAEEALELGLVDALAYPDQFDELIDERAGGDPSILSIERYGRRLSLPRGQNVAIVFVQGVIHRGHDGIEPWTGELHVGSRDLGALLRRLSEDEATEAVVLRIDSPGGSALASDLILREVELLAAEKPVIVSMSDLAASGGYYIATKARRIVAEPSTLTGSIGVFGGKLVTRRFESELLGITHDLTKRGDNADIYSTQELFTEEQAARVQARMERIYDDFVGHVATGRDMSVEEVLEVAEGRVWTGSAALRIGLVDALGGFEEALRLTREELGVAADARLRLQLYPEPPDLLDYLLGRAQPPLPIRIPEALRALGDDHFELLELPPALADLASPF